jgi:hypothetical protein
MSRPADNYDTLAYRDDILFQRRESKSTRNQTLCTGRDWIVIGPRHPNLSGANNIFVNG